MTKLIGGYVALSGFEPTPIDYPPIENEISSSTTKTDNISKSLFVDKIDEVDPLTRKFSELKIASPIWNNEVVVDAISQFIDLDSFSNSLLLNKHICKLLLESMTLQRARAWVLHCPKIIRSQIFPKKFLDDYYVILNACKFDASVCLLARPNLLKNMGRQLMINVLAEIILGKQTLEIEALESIETLSKQCLPEKSSPIWSSLEDLAGFTLDNGINSIDKKSTDEKYFDIFKTFYEKHGELCFDDVIEGLNNLNEDPKDAHYLMMFLPYRSVMRCKEIVEAIKRSYYTWFVIASLNRQDQELIRTILQLAPEAKDVLKSF